MLKELVKNHKKDMIKVSIGRILVSIMVVIFIAFMIVMVEYAIPSKNIKLVVNLGIVYFIVAFFRMLATYFEHIEQEVTQKNIESDYRERVFLKLLKLKEKEIDKVRVGEILENIINDTKEISKYFTMGITRSYLGGGLRLLGTLAVLMYLNIPIVIITFLIYLIGFFITYLFNKKSIKFTKIKREVNAKILNWSNEQVQGYQTIKSLEIQNARLSEIKQLISEYEKAVNRLEKNIRIYTCIYDFLIGLVGIITILLGTISVEKGILSYGAIVILSRYIDQPEVYARWVVEGFQIRNVSKISFNKVINILEKEEEDIEEGENLEIVDNVEFDNVSFLYNESKNVLNNVSFTAKRNENIALIGRTGSGKTTLVNLICRFYDLQTGQIRINGKDYREYSIKSLRNSIGYIMQKVVIFNGTILENINFSNKDISKEEIIEICKKLNLHEKIMSLKDGYETKISSDTDIFSAGEKQLLNFSRVMVQDPQIIILDEVTASLSYKSEMLVRKTIEEITRGKISFIIAHRLSTIKKCDKIILMKDGRIIEEGNHNELMEKHGEYYNLINA